MPNKSVRKMSDISPVSRRVRSEAMTLKRSPIPGVSFKESSREFNEGILTIRPPKGSIYEGDTMRIQLTFGQDYPAHKPSSRMLTRIYHPNISQKDGICINCLVSGYNNQVTIARIAEEFIAALDKPGLEDPLDKDAAYDWANNKDEFIRKAREIVEDNKRLN